MLITVRLPSAATNVFVGPRVGAGILDHDRLVAPYDLFQQRIALDLQSGCDFPDSFALATGKVDQPHLLHVLVVRNAEPDMGVAGRRQCLDSSDLEQILKRACAL